MPVPLRLSPPATVLTTLLSGLKLSLIRMMPITQRPKILRRIIITHRITLLMIHLIRIGTAQSHTPVIILNRPLAPMPVTIQYQGANPRPIRIEPALTLTTPNHTNLTKKNRQSPRHITKNHGDCLSSNPNRHKEIQWQKNGFLPPATASGC